MADTEEIRRRAGWDPLEDRLDPERVAEFDRWLNEFARAKWEAGAMAEYSAAVHTSDPRPRNPYAVEEPSDA